MIKRINRIKGIASYTDFSGTSIDEFNKFNIIYGENGSGKTVLSKLISLYSEVEDPIIKEDIYSNLFSENSIVEIMINDNPIKLKKTDFPAEKIYVFNSLFISNYLHDGSQTNAKRFDTNDSVVARLESPLIGQLKKSNDKLSIEIGNTDKDGIRKDIIELKNKIEISSKLVRDEWNSQPILKGKNIVKPENNFIKKPRVIKLVQKDIDRNLKELELMQRDDFSVDADTLHNLKKDQLGVGLDMVYGDINTVVKNIARDNVVEKIQNFINSRTIDNVQEWFDNGMTLLNSQKKEEKLYCPLCNSKLDYVIDDLITDYQGYFDETHKSLNDKLEQHITALNAEISSLNNRDEVALNNLISKYKAVIGEELEEIDFSGIDELNEFFKSILTEINKKKRDYTYLTKLDFQILKESIEEYNRFVKNFNKSKGTIFDYLESRISSTKIDTRIRKLYYEKFSDLVITSTKMSNPINALMSFEKMKADKEEEKEENLRKIRDEVIKMQVESANINKYLLKLNITKFKVSLEDHLNVVYTEGTIKDSLRHSLSEGEKTTLAFAYFLSKMAYEVGKENYKDYIVFMDDPISSIDEDRMFNTANIIYAEFKDIKQLFICSHSFKFLRILNNFMKFYNRSKKIEKQDLNIYKGRCNNGSELLNFPKETAFFTTMYYSKLQLIVKYLSEELLTEDEKKSIPNSVRIVLESFLSFKFGYLRGEKYGITPGLKDLFEAVKKEDDAIFENLVEVEGINKDNWKDELDYLFSHYTNMFSHGNPSAVDNDEPPTTDNELRKFCNSTIAIIKFLDGIHFKLAPINCIREI